jgi:hypothetical protein
LLDAEAVQQLLLLELVLLALHCRGQARWRAGQRPGRLVPLDRLFPVLSFLQPQQVHLLPLLQLRLRDSLLRWDFWALLGGWAVHALQLRLARPVELLQLNPARSRFGGGRGEGGQQGQRKHCRLGASGHVNKPRFPSFQTTAGAKRSAAAG